MIKVESRDVSKVLERRQTSVSTLRADEFAPLRLRVVRSKLQAPQAPQAPLEKEVNSKRFWVVLGCAALVAVMAIAVFVSRTTPSSNNVCELYPDMCEGNLGIPRNQMPQLEDDVKENFLATFEHEVETLPARDLTPIQNEGNMNKINGMMNATLSGKWDACSGNPILTSSDRYIIDGHHRAFTCQLLNRSMAVIRMVTMNATEALKAAISFPGVEHHDINFFAK